MSEQHPPAPRLVRDLMTVGVETCTPDTRLTELARLLLEKELEGVVVLDDENRSLGIVTQDELVRAYSRPNAPALRARDVMREGVPDIPPDIPLEAAAAIMQDMGLRVVFLMHNAAGIIYPAATLSYRHILRHLAAANGGDLGDLGIEARREAPLDTFRRRRDAALRQAQGPDQE